MRFLSAGLLLMPLLFGDSPCSCWGGFLLGLYADDLRITEFIHCSHLIVPIPRTSRTSRTSTLASTFLHSQLPHQTPGHPEVGVDDGGGVKSACDSKALTGLFTISLSACPYLRGPLEPIQVPNRDVHDPVLSCDPVLPWGLVLHRDPVLPRNPVLPDG